MLTYWIRHSGGFVFGSALVFLGVLIWFVLIGVFGIIGPLWPLLLALPFVIVGLLLIVFAAIKWLWSAA